MLAVLLMLMALTLLASFYCSSTEARYEGKTVCAWFEEFRNAPVTFDGETVTSKCGPDGRELYSGDTGRRLPDPAMEALRALGPKSLPFLSAQLRVRETSLTRLYRECSILLPWSVRKILPGLKDRDLVRNDAINVLFGLGKDAEPIVPHLLAMLRQENEESFAFSSGLQLLGRLGAPDAEINRLVEEFSRSGKSKQAELILSALHHEGEDSKIKTVASQSRRQY
jgi:hypothetical protein